MGNHLKNSTSLEKLRALSLGSEGTSSPKHLRRSKKSICHVSTKEGDISIEINACVFHLPLVIRFLSLMPFDSLKISIPACNWAFPLT